eukprot:TRINITY_DN2945_c0_g1_i4.p4 TRINITY_DN2945_c0_g1~~TRINITY_DN2945_c0_g1_i4.p4  ORF type:complete len:102 (+),score=24.24 TRINITY_DN2945_c0_g1_i4:44-307(+)
MAKRTKIDWTLAPHRHQPRGKPVLVCILDGVGLGPEDQFDAVHVARTPTLDALRATALFGRIRAHGVAVGLPSDRWERAGVGVGVGG